MRDYPPRCLGRAGGAAGHSGDVRGRTEILEAEDRPWVTVVWDDPVNLMHYVAYIFQKLFGYSKAKATELMLKVHKEGKAVVSSGPGTRWNTMSAAARRRTLGHHAAVTTGSRT